MVNLLFINNFNPCETSNISGLNKRNEEECGQYGFSCFDKTSYRICRSNRFEEKSTKMDSEDTGSEYEPEDDTKLCPEGSICDEDNVFYCSEAGLSEKQKIQSEEKEERQFKSKGNVGAITSLDEKQVSEDNFKSKPEEVIHLQKTANVNNPECPKYDVSEEEESNTQNRPEIASKTLPYENVNCKKAGKVPDPNCCYVYYNCDHSGDDEDTLVPVRKFCPDRKVFDPLAKECVSPSKIGSSFRQQRHPSFYQSDVNNFICSSEGKFPDPNNCSKYYSCDLSRNGCGLIATLHCCEKGTVFDPEEQECVLKDQSIPNGTGEFEQYDCFRAGNFPDPNSCSKYFTCKLKEDGCGFVSTHHRCRENKIFDPVQGKCTCKKPKTQFDNFPCFIEGKFPDPDDEHCYYLCSVRPHCKGYLATRHHCAAGKIFDKECKKCISKSRILRYESHIKKRQRYPTRRNRVLFKSVANRKINHIMHPKLKTKKREKTFYSRTRPNHYFGNNHISKRN